MVVECGTDSGLIVAIRDLVGYDGDSALLTLGSNEHGALSNVDRTWRRLDDHERRVYRAFGQAGQGSDPGFEVGDDDGV